MNHTQITKANQIHIQEFFSAKFWTKFWTGGNNYQTCCTGQMAEVFSAKVQNL